MLASREVEKASRGSEMKERRNDGVRHLSLL